MEEKRNQMKESSKIKLIKIATILQQIESRTRYNGVEGLALCQVEILNDLGRQIEEIVNVEMNEKTKGRKQK